MGNTSAVFGRRVAHSLHRGFTMATRVLTPEQHARRVVTKREWYARNREKVLQGLRERTDEERAGIYARRKERYQTEPEYRAAILLAAKRYRIKPEARIATKAYNRAYNLSEKGQATKRADRLRRYFNLTIERYDAMLTEQDGLCAICREPETRRHRGRGVVIALAVDHDHRCCPGKTSCGKCVRGLLCDRCNLGRWPDDPALLRAAADYFARRNLPAS